MLEHRDPSPTATHDAPTGEAPTMSGGPSERRLANPVAALRHRPFRWLWAGQLFNSTGMWMDQMVRGWLVYDLTGSVSQLALVAAARSLPLLVVGLVGGVLADRLDRRRLLLGAHALTGVLHALVAGLVASGQLEVWHVYLTAVGVGVGNAVKAPARQSLLPATVPAGTLQNAVVLNSGTLTVGQSLGPAVGGALIAAVGFGPTFATQALVAFAALAATGRIDIDGRPADPRRDSVLSSIAEGFRYVRGNGIVLTLLLLALVPLFLVAPHQQLVPAVAAEELLVGATETGVLLAASGAGAFVSFLALAFAPPLRRPGVVLLAGVLGYATAVAVFGASQLYALSVVTLFVAGVLRTAYRTLTQNLLISHTDDAYLGRVNSIYLLDRGIMPLGAVTIGFAAEVVGTGTALTVAGVVCVAACAAVAARARALRAA